MYKIRLTRTQKRRREKLQQFFDCYSLCDLEFWSHGPEIFKFNDCERHEIAILFDKTVDEFYQYVRKELDRVVFGEIGHYDHRCRGALEGATVRKIRKTRDAWTAEYIFKNLDWHSEYGGPLWGEAAAFLLKHPRTAHEKMAWVDKVMDLQHNNGQIFSGKNSPLEVMEDWQVIAKDIPLCEYDSALDIRASGNMPEWKALWSRRNSKIIDKYAGRVKHRYRTLKQS